MATPSDVLSDLKRRHQSVWASGNYALVGSLIVIMAERLVDFAELRSGSRVLDAATGSGNGALAAARLQCDVTGLDFVPSLLERARARAHVEGFRIEFREGDVEAMPFADASFDATMSVVGVMFAPDHRQTAREITRVTRPGGTIALASWKPDGFIGDFFRVVAAFAPPAPGAVSPMLWGKPEHLDDIFEKRVEWRHQTEIFNFRFPSPDAFVRYFVDYYGPTVKALATAGEKGAAFRTALADLARSKSVLTSGDGAISIPATYLASAGRYRG